MFNNFSSFVQKAQSAAQQLIDPMQGLNLTNSDKHPSRASLFQNQFRLPSSQTPLYEIPAELTIPPSNITQGDKDRDRGWHYAGKLHLSESYICFSTTPTSFSNGASPSSSAAFTGQTHGAGPSGNGFTFPLCAIRRVERLNSQNFQVWRDLSRSKLPYHLRLTLGTLVCSCYYDMERYHTRVGQGQRCAKRQERD